MNVYELNEEQKTYLKGCYLDNLLYETEKRGASYGELLNAGAIVPDSVLYSEYEGYIFTDNDFAF